MNLVLLMHDVERIQDLLHYILDSCLRHLSGNGLNNRGKVTSVHPLHDQIESIIILKGLEDTNDVLVDLACHVLKGNFCQSVFEITLVFGCDDLHSKMLSCLYVLTEENLSKASFTKCGQFLKVPERVALDDVVTDLAHPFVEVLVIFHDGKARSGSEID